MAKSSNSSEGSGSVYENVPSKPGLGGTGWVVLLIMGPVFLFFAVSMIYGFVMLILALL